MSIILGILAGIGLPVQTSINTALRKKVGSPYNASLVSFVVALLFLVLLLLVTGQFTFPLNDSSCKNLAGFGPADFAVSFS